MRIAIMAPQSAGKTCYLASLYGELTDLINYPVDKERLHYKFTDTTQDGFLESLLYDLLNGIMPQSTDGYDDYYMSIVDRDNRRSTQIEIVDFPGGLLKKIGGEDKKNAIEDVDSRLKKCDAFIVLIDSNHIEKNKLLFKNEIAASHISELLLNVSANKRNDKFSLEGVPFIFALSKVDKVDNEILEKAYQTIQNVFGQFFESDDCVSVITQVSIGKNIDGSDESIEKGDYSPKNIFLPFYLAVGIGTMSGARYGKSRIEELNDVREELESERIKLKESAEWASDIYHSRKNRNILDRAWLAITTGVDADDLYRDKSHADYKHNDKIKEIDDTIIEINSITEEVKSLRNCGVIVLNKIKDKYTDHVNDAIIIKNKRKLKLIKEINTETDNIFTEV